MAADNIMGKDRENTMVTAAAIAFAAPSDAAGEVDAFRLPALAGVPTATPANGGEGHQIWDSVGNKLYIWDGAAWDNQNTVDSTEQVCNLYSAAVSIATVPHAVFIDGVGIVNGALGSGSTQSRMIGWVTASVATDVLANVCSEGVIGGFTGLTTGSKYWLDDGTSGAITSVIPAGAGNQIIVAGYAKSTTEIHAQIGGVGKRA